MAPRSKKSRLSADAPADFFGHRKRWVVASDSEQVLRHRRNYAILTAGDVYMNFVAKNFSELSLVELYEILKARSQVFIVEQNMRCQDMDGVDQKARHFFIEENGKVLAYLRAFYADNSKTVVRIGRVLSITHGVGLGADIMRKALADIKEAMRCKKIVLDSQKTAIGFYEKLGFETVSDEFLEEGVIHVVMELEI